MQNARFKPMHVFEAKLYHHLVFQIAFRNIQRKKVIAIFWVIGQNLGPVYIVLL